MTCPPYQDEASREGTLETGWRDGDRMEGQVMGWGAQMTCPFVRAPIHEEWENQRIGGQVICFPAPDQRQRTNG
jgi:hypothetical protein